MKIREFLFSMLIFSGIFIAGAMFFTDVASSYHKDTPSQLDSVRYYVEHDIKNATLGIGDTGKNISQKPSITGINEVDVALSFFGSIASQMWGLAMVLFGLPDMILNFGYVVADQFAIPHILVQIIIGLITIFVVFELISLIFKRET